MAIPGSWGQVLHARFSHVWHRGKAGAHVQNAELQDLTPYLYSDWGYWMPPSVVVGRRGGVAPIPSLMILRAFMS